MTAAVTPAALVTPALSRVIGAWKKSVATLRGHAEWKSVDVSTLLSIYVSFTTIDISRLAEPSLRLRDFLLHHTELGQRSVKAVLDEVLTADTHLRAACRTPWGAAKALEVVLLDQLARLPHIPDSDDFSDGALTAIAIEQMYKSPYARHGFVHVYNLALERQTIHVPLLDASIMTLLDTDIPLITGESTPVSRLHQPGTGNCFISFTDHGYDDDFAWLQTKRESAVRLVQVMQYLKYGIVAVDYAGLYFVPAWVNRVSRTGVYVWGTPRQFATKAPYMLRTAEEELLLRYLQLAVSRSDIIADDTGSLGKTRQLAGEYYEAHHTRDTLEDRLLDLTISLEALFSPGREMELSYRMAQSAALLVGDSNANRRRIFDLLRKVYDERSKLVHGGGSPFVQNRLAESDLGDFGDVIRQAILRFLAWQARGMTRREDALKMLTQASLDQELLKEIQRQTDVTTFATEG